MAMIYGFFSYEIRKLKLTIHFLAGPVQKSKFIKYIYRVSQVKLSITAFQLAIPGSKLWQAPWTIELQN